MDMDRTVAKSRLRKPAATPAMPQKPSAQPQGPRWPAHQIEISVRVLWFFVILAIFASAILGGIADAVNRYVAPRFRWFVAWPKTQA